MRKIRDIKGQLILQERWWTPKERSEDAGVQVKIEGNQKGNKLDIKRGCWVYNV
jgi:hypothetical protein